MCWILTWFVTLKSLLTSSLNYCVSSRQKTKKKLSFFSSLALLAIQQNCWLQNSKKQKTWYEFKISFTHTLEPQLILIIVDKLSHTMKINSVGLYGAVYLFRSLHRITMNIQNDDKTSWLYLIPTLWPQV